MAVFGIVLTTVGAILPSVIERFGMATQNAGALFLLLSFGILAGSVVFGPTVDRYGYKGMLLMATVLIILGIEGIALAGSLGLLRASVLLIGFGGGVINGGTNALVADISAEGRSAGLSLLGIFFGVGAVGVPFTLGMLLGRFSYSVLLAGIGVLVLGPLVYIAVTRFPAPKQPQGFPVADGIRLLREPFILLTGLMLFLESGIEITVGGWTATYFTRELGLAAGHALFFLSLYWLGMMLARLTLGSLLRRTIPARVMMSCIGVALLGSAFLIGSRSVLSAALGVFLIGVGFAATYPVVLGYVGDRYARLSGTAFSIVLVMALIGGMVLPYVTGVVGGARGLRTSFLIVPLALVLQVLLLTVIARRVVAEAGVSPVPNLGGDDLIA